MRNSQITWIAAIVSLGGFLFGFDAAIIAGVAGSVERLFDLDPVQVGWVVSSPSFAAMFAMASAGAIGNKVGRKRILILVALLYAISALLSAISGSYEMLYISRMIGGLAFGAALILAPMYIAEISTAENRGRLVSIQQLNIVIGFSAAYFTSYYLNELSGAGLDWINEDNGWRWMLGIELVPAVIYMAAMFFVPNSPRWLMLKRREEEASDVLTKLHGEAFAKEEVVQIKKSLTEESGNKGSIKDLLNPTLRFVLVVGLIVGILQQITGINAIFFYATSIFEQTGIGTDAAFAQSVVVGIINVVATLIVMVLIDRLGRRPLLLIGILGVALSMMVTSYGFRQATYQLTPESVAVIEDFDAQKLESVIGVQFDNDLAFNKALETALGEDGFKRHRAELLKAGANMNAYLILFGILGFVASFAFSLGPVMWVLLSEMFPTRIRAVAIGFVGLVNSFTSWLIQQVFPWEIANLGNATTYLIFAVLAMIGFALMYRYLPETKGKSLEELEQELIK